MSVCSLVLVFSVAYKIFVSFEFLSSLCMFDSWSFILGSPQISKDVFDVFIFRSKVLKVD